MDYTDHRCPRCRYHRPQRTITVVVRIFCPNCRYIEQGRRSPAFDTLTRLGAWLSAQFRTQHSAFPIPDEEVSHVPEPSRNGHGP